MGSIEHCFLSTRRPLDHDCDKKSKSGWRRRLGQGAEAIRSQYPRTNEWAVPGSVVQDEYLLGMIKYQGRDVKGTYRATDGGIPPRVSSRRHQGILVKVSKFQANETPSSFQECRQQDIEVGFLGDADKARRPRATSHPPVILKGHRLGDQGFIRPTSGSPHLFSYVWNDDLS